MKYFNFKILTLLFALTMAIPPAWGEETLASADYSSADNEESGVVYTGDGTWSYNGTATISSSYVYFRTGGSIVYTCSSYTGEATVTVTTASSYGYGDLTINGVSQRLTNSSTTDYSITIGSDRTITFTSTDSYSPNITKIVISIASASLPSTLEIAPESLTINDDAAGTFTITGTNIEGSINANLTNTADWSLTPETFSNTGGNVNVTYTGRALSANNTITAVATNDNTVSAQATVNYLADLYIVTDNGVTNSWDFSNGTHMNYSNGTYSAMFTASADNTYILFARKLGDGVTWNTRYVFGPNSSGDWEWGTYTSGTIDLNDDDPIKLPAGTYNITIDANTGTFNITKTLEQVATPTFSHESGTTFTESVDVTINCATAGSTIYYTIDGSTPSTSSTQYTGAITVTTTTTIQAIAIKDNMADSEIAQATYTKQDPVATPTFSLASGTYNAAQTVTISCATNGATIYYTIDGSVPSTSSTHYTGAITLSKSTQLRAIAVKDGMGNSSVATATYIIENTGGELTIADGTDYVLIGPIYGGKFDKVGWVQMLYPGVLLESMDGATISTITFYPKDEYSTGKFDLYIGEIDGTDISSELDLTLAATQVNVIRNSTDPLTIDISPYVYQGGNLVLKTKVTNSYANNNAVGNSQNHQWYGNNDGGTVTTSYSGSTTYHQNWLPKTTFTYEGGATAKPQGTVSPTDVDFATGVTGYTYTQTITITNIGSVPFTPVIDDTNVSAPFSVSCTATELTQEGDQVVVTATYAPTMACNVDEGSFIVVIGDTEYFVNLTGKAVEAQQGAAVTVSPEAGTIDFGKVSWNDHESKQISIIVTNTGSEIITPSISALSNGFTTDYLPRNLATGEQAVITITFTPQAIDTYSTTATLSFDNEAISDMVYTLTGTGYSPYDHKADFDEITYEWVDDETGETKTSKLSDIAYDPNQIIAMLRTVYMDKRVPGNKNRGYNIIGQREKWKVGYPAVGQMNSSGEYVDTYGWNIPPKSDTPLEITLDGTTYKYFDPTDYEPDEEGVTLIMVELKDGTDFAGEENYYSFSNGDLYTKVKDAYKSARVITSYKRAGIGTEKEATLFKIDADKLNRFILLGKGKLRLQDHTNSNFAYEFCEPSLKGSTYTDNDYSSAIMAPFIHMFEEFSPNIASTGSSAETDEYLKLINMESFYVIHDCPSASFIDGHHEVNMYGINSTSDDCQDVRDMMFTVPERRMTYFDNDGISDKRDPSPQEKFVNYYKVGDLDLRPKMGLYVIRQNEITGEKQADADVYDLNLSWVSNLLDFLPGAEAQYELFRVTIDENGNKFYTKVATLDPNQTTYVDHVPMTTDGQEVTYVVQGQDNTQFLSLQMSNEESYIIPGTDPSVIFTLSPKTSDYARFDPLTESNYYANEMTVKNNVGTNIKGKYLGDGATFTFYRTPSWGATTGDKVPVAIARSNGNGTLAITMQNQNRDGKYRNWINMANPSQVQYTVDASGNVTFNSFTLYDNFAEPVANNDHPSLYIYEVDFVASQTIDGLQDNKAHSNQIGVFVHKTDMNVLGYSQEQVDADKDHELATGIRRISEEVKYSSKTEILRYDAYRWKQYVDNYGEIIDFGNSTFNATTHALSETDVEPTGQAGNQGGSYTVKMDGANSQGITIGQGQALPVTYVDNVVEDEWGMYTYAPVVETFTSRSDYNTYGAPLQQTGVAAIHDSVIEATMSSENEGGSIWEEDGKKYTHYTVLLNMDELNIPIDEADMLKDYDLYKVRVWRQVDADLLNEQKFDEDKYPEKNRQARLEKKVTIGGKVYGEFLMEELDHSKFSRATVLDEAQQDGNRLGNSNVMTFYPTWKPGSYEVMATFGAQKLIESNGETGCIEELPMSFIVRAYYTRTANIPEMSTTRSLNANRGIDTAADKKYYIAEYKFDYTLTRNNIVTGLGSVSVDRQMTSVTYYNMMGQQSSKPFDGVNIVVTRYNDGTTMTTKVVK